MIDRGMKKWRPFNSVVSAKELLTRPTLSHLPDLDESEIEEIEELLKSSMYTHSAIKIFYIENGAKKIIEDTVIDLDSIKKDVILKSKRINFRQIYKVKK